MKAYVTTVGEKTTEVCVEQLIRFGYKVVILDHKESWDKKYQRFINMAAKEEKECIRIDPDVIVNKNFRIEHVKHHIEILKDAYMIQWQVYDFYRNDVHTGQPLYYSPTALNIIQSNLRHLLISRPETSAWRLREINPHTKTVEEVAGMHGFFQDDAAFERGATNKYARGHASSEQIELAKKLRSL